MEMKNVTVIDSVMGAGKTTYAINKINAASPLERFIYITPFLAEVDRVISSATGRSFAQPSTNVEGGSKLTSLKQLIAGGKDIAATHSLFEMADVELRELLRENNYTLILDEVMSVIDNASVSPSDMRLLMERGFIKIENHRVVWNANEAEYEYGVYDHIKLQAQAGTLYYMRDKFLIYAFPPKIFETFTEVYVLTYLFEAQLMKYYFDLYKIPYELRAVKGGHLVEYNKRDEGREALRALINLYDGAHNRHGDIPTAFSVRWLGRQSEDQLEEIQSSMYSFVRNVAKAKANAVLWTTVKKHQSDLKGKGYAKGFLACNARATNEYADRSTLMYCYNRFMHPNERAFFECHDITVSQDKLAVSDLLQWVWRSRIRNGESINLYMPARRMRELLEKWARYEI
ncbi:DEAD/DEAH box helicase family protein [Lysinibacillus sphaericus]|uniref:DEAD/DEAH box helicase family protein n=2 Tax=Lysinibacillus sphaericus TaxID=1421 RepID=UPI001F51195B|nr:DEAD/DEAH box helicase family protein [Lysinibacillus sphaericus]